MSNSIDEDSERRARINRLIELEGLSQKQFAERIGESTANLNKILNGKRGVPNTMPGRIVSAFPEVRMAWILYGEGEMYNKDQQIVDAALLQKHMEALPTRPRLPKNIPARDSLELYYNGQKRMLCQEKPIIAQFQEYDFSLIIKNNSMSPKYELGDEVFFKEALFPEWGNDFLLDTDDGPKFKRIYDNHEKDEQGRECITCVSYNKEEFPSFLIPKEYVHGFYRCVGVLRIL